MSKKQHSAPLGRQSRSDRSEYRLYFAIILPISLISVVASRIGKSFRSSDVDLRTKPHAKSIWADALTQTNSIVPYIFSR